jgi:hypothetical protein
MKPITPFSRIFCTGHCRLLKADKPSTPSPRERERLKHSDSWKKDEEEEEEVPSVW